MPLVERGSEKGLTSAEETVDLAYDEDRELGCDDRTPTYAEARCPICGHVLSAHQDRRGPFWFCRGCYDISEIRRSKS